MSVFWKNVVETKHTTEKDNATETKDNVADPRADQSTTGKMRFWISSLDTYLMN